MNNVTVCGTDAVLQCMIEQNQSCMEEVCHKVACLRFKLCSRFERVWLQSDKVCVNNMSQLVLPGVVAMAGESADFT